MRIRRRSEPQRLLKKCTKAHDKTDFLRHFARIAQTRNFVKLSPRRFTPNSVPPKSHRRSRTFCENFVIVNSTSSSKPSPDTTLNDLLHSITLFLFGIHVYFSRRSDSMSLLARVRCACGHYLRRTRRLRLNSLPRRTVNNCRQIFRILFARAPVLRYSFSRLFHGTILVLFKRSTRYVCTSTAILFERKPVFFSSFNL